jgi:zinc protease
MTDRLSRKLRDEMGLAYTVWARVARGADLDPGTFAAYIGTAPASRQQAIDAMRAEIERFVAGPVLEEEVEDARRYLVGGYVFGFETADQVAEQIVQMERLSLGFDHPAEFVRRVEAVTVAEVEAAARRHIHPDRLVTVTVGRGE